MSPPPAPLSRRAAAKLVDALVLAPPAGLCAAALGAGPLGSPGISLVILVTALVLPLAVLGYQSSLIVATGQSLGKRVLGLEIIATDGEPVDRITVALRLWLPLTLLLVPPAIGLVSEHLFSRRWMMGGWTFVGIAAAADALSALLPDGRSLHDQLAGTSVVVALVKPTGTASPAQSRQSAPARAANVDHSKLALRALGRVAGAMGVVFVLAVAAAVLGAIVLVLQFLSSMG